MYVHHNCQGLALVMLQHTSTKKKKYFSRTYTSTSQNDGKVPKPNQLNMREMPPFYQIYSLCWDWNTKYQVDIGCVSVYQKSWNPITVFSRYVALKTLAFKSCIPLWDSRGKTIPLAGDSRVKAMFLSPLKIGRTLPMHTDIGYLNIRTNWISVHSAKTVHFSRSGTMT